MVEWIGFRLMQSICNDLVYKANRVKNMPGDSKISAAQKSQVALASALYVLHPYSSLSFATVISSVVNTSNLMAIRSLQQHNPFLYGILFTVALAVPLNGSIILTIPYLSMVTASLCSKVFRAGSIFTALIICALVTTPASLLNPFVNQVNIEKNDSPLSADNLVNLSPMHTKPNRGVSWYLFLEVFERFFSYFKYVFDVLPGILCLPLWFQWQCDQTIGITYILLISLYMQSETNFNMYSISTVFLYLYLWKRSSSAVEYFAITGLIVTSVMYSVMYYKWLYLGTGNANYVYNQNLAFVMLHLFACNKYLLGF